MGRFQLELIYYFTYFSPSSHPTLVCFFPVGLSLLIQHFQQVLWVFKFLLSPDLGSSDMPTVKIQINWARLGLLWYVRIPRLFWTNIDEGLNSRKNKIGNTVSFSFVIPNETSTLGVSRSLSDAPYGSSYSAVVFVLFPQEYKMAFWRIICCPLNYHEEG